MNEYKYKWIPGTTWPTTAVEVWGSSATHIYQGKQCTMVAIFRAADAPVGLRADDGDRTGLHLRYVRVGGQLRSARKEGDKAIILDRHMEPLFDVPLAFGGGT